MPTVQLAFSAAPQYVRTARLVAVAVARRAGVPDELLDEVRLAIGEACSRAIARHRRHGITELVRVEMSDDGPYTVQVRDSGGTETAGTETAGTETAGTETGGDGTGTDGRGGRDGTDGAVGAGNGAGPAAAGDDEDADRMQEALLAAVARDLEIIRHGAGTEVRMVWPVRRRLSGWSAPHRAETQL